MRTWSCHPHLLTGCTPTGPVLCWCTVSCPCFPIQRPREARPLPCSSPLPCSTLGGMWGIHIGASTMAQLSREEYLQGEMGLSLYWRQRYHKPKPQCIILVPTCSMPQELPSTDQSETAQPSLCPQPPLDCSSPVQPSWL